MESEMAMLRAKQLPVKLIAIVSKKVFKNRKVYMSAIKS